MAFVVGIYGTIGSGKSTVARILQNKYGFYYIDGDSLAHRVYNLKEVKRDLIKLFGLQIISKEGIIQRKKIAQVVFTNPIMKNELEQLLWPKMSYMLQEVLREESEIIIDAAVLFKSHWNLLCQVTIYVEAPWEEVIKRLENRGLNKEILKKIQCSQMEIVEEKDLATFQIQNNGSIQELTKKVMEIASLIKEGRMKHD
jgi:dephospho-CoA kinase